MSGASSVAPFYGRCQVNERDFFAVMLAVGSGGRAIGSVGDIGSNTTMSAAFAEKNSPMTV